MLSLGIAAAVLLALVIVQQWRMTHTAKDAQYRKGYEAGRSELLNSIRYEQEILETKRSGLMRKETVLKVRERVMLGTLRIAETERDIVLASEVNEKNVWNALEQAHSLALAGNPAVASFARLIAPAAKLALASRKS